MLNKTDLQISPSALVPPGTAVDPNAPNEVNTIPVAVESFEANDFAITVDVHCHRTDAALDQWRIETHSAILQAYSKMIGDYQDQLKAQSFQKNGQPTVGGNPDQNRQIERMELKKACIALLTGSDVQYFDSNFASQEFGAIQDATKYWLPDRSKAEEQGRFIRFFEQAFEWENITYLFYPYFWAPKLSWREKALTNNTDFLFAQFLQAGSARVVVPVRLQLESDVRYYLMTGQIWRGGGLPEITDTDYLPITDEIKDRDNAPGDEKPQGDPWEVVLPTTLIKLRDDDSLPIWEKFVVPAPTPSPGPPGGQTVWVPGRMKDGQWAPDYGILNNGKWSPQ